MEVDVMEVTLTVGWPGVTEPIVTVGTDIESAYYSGSKNS